MPEVSQKLPGPEAPDVEIEPLEWAGDLVLVQMDNTDAWVSCDEDSLMDVEE